MRALLGGAVRCGFLLASNEVTVTRDVAGDIRRRLDLVAEHIQSMVRQVAEGVALTNERIDRLDSEVRRGFSEPGSMIRLS